MAAELLSNEEAVAGILEVPAHFERGPSSHTERRRTGSLSFPTPADDIDIINGPEKGDYWGQMLAHMERHPELSLGTSLSNTKRKQLLRHDGFLDRTVTNTKNGQHGAGGDRGVGRGAAAVAVALPPVLAQRARAPHEPVGERRWA